MALSSVADYLVFVIFSFPVFHGNIFLLSTWSMWLEVKSGAFQKVNYLEWLKIIPLRDKYLQAQILLKIRRHCRHFVLAQGGDPICVFMGSLMMIIFIQSVCIFKKRRLGKKLQHFTGMAFPPAAVTVNILLIRCRSCWLPYISST